MNKMMISLAAGMIMVLAACNDSKNDAAQIEVKAAQTQQSTAKTYSELPVPAEGTFSTIDWSVALAAKPETVVFVDVRNAGELNEGYVKGSENIPIKELSRRAQNLPKDKSLLVYCRSGRRSELASKYLVSQGFTRVYNIAGGYSAYPSKVAASEVASEAEVPAAPAVEQPKASITDVEWDRALEMQKSGAFMVDVRTPEEVAQGMVPGAVNIPLQEIKHRLNEVPKDKILLVYCRSGKRSMAASQILIENGYTQVNNVVGGILAFPQ